MRAASLVRTRLRLESSHIGAAEQFELPPEQRGEDHGVSQHDEGRPQERVDQPEPLKHLADQSEDRW